MSSEIIFRYELDGVGTKILRMPEGAEIIHFGMRLSERYFSLWAKMSFPQKERVLRKFRIIPTGQDFSVLEGETLKYIQTCIIPNEEVWHLFEVLPE